MTKNIVFFAPFKFVNEHYLIESKIMDAFLKLDHNVYVISCGGFMSKSCKAMNSVGIGLEDSNISKKLICHACKKITQETSRVSNKIKIIIMDESEIFKKCSQEIKSLDYKNLDELIHFELDGIYIGKICLYNIVIRYKLSNLELDEKIVNDFKYEIKKVTQIMKYMENFFQENSTDEVFFYNGLYPENAVVKLIADKRGIKVRSIQNENTDLTRNKFIRVSDDPAERVNPKYTHEWKKNSHYLKTSNEVDNVINHFYRLRNSKSDFIYSTSLKETDKKSIFKKYWDTPKKVVFIPLSSMDEINAVYLLDDKKSLNYKDQLEFLDQILEIAALHPEILFIVRPHPREFPNKREKAISKNLPKLLQRLENTNHNVVVNTPEDNISIYEIAQFTDLTINYASSVGMEMCALGINVLTVEPELNSAFPLNLSLTIKDKVDIEKNFEYYLSANLTKDNIENSLSWVDYLLHDFNISLLTSKEVSRDSLDINQNLSFLLYRWIKKIQILKIFTLTYILPKRYKSDYKKFILNESEFQRLIKNQSNQQVFGIQGVDKVLRLNLLRTYLVQLINEFKKQFGQDTKLTKRLVNLYSEIK